MENKRILVIGGAGYIGREVVKCLEAEGFTVTVLLREKLSGYEKKHIICDLLDKECLRKNINDFDVVINLAAIVRTIYKSRYKDNLAGLKNLIDVLKEKHINKLVYFSTQNVNIKNKGPYAKSKSDCENLLKNSGLSCIIIRPNLVYGIDKENDFFRLIKLISKFRIAPIIGSGENKFQPILKNDLAKITADLIKNYTPGVVEISGDETISINQVVSKICQALNISVGKLHIPAAWLKILRAIIPFDIDGYEENKISANAIKGETHFFNNLNAIVCLYEKK